MLHSCDIENCEHMLATMVEKGKIQKKGQMYCMTRVPNDVSYKNNTFIHVFLHTTFRRMQLYGQNGHVSIVNIKEILLFNVICLVLHASFEDACYEHVPLVKSGEDNQSQLKRVLIKQPVPTLYTIVPHSFQLTFCKQRIVLFLLLIIAQGWGLFSVRFDWLDDHDDSLYLYNL